MVVGIDFPTWNTLSDPVKSLISFMLEDASLFFVDESDEDNDYCTGVICTNQRYRIVEGGWYNNYYDDSITDYEPQIFHNNDILFAIPYVDVEDLDTNIILNCYTGLPYDSYNTRLTTVNSKFNIYFSNFIDYDTPNEGCAFAQIAPLCDIPVTITPLLVDDESNTLKPISNTNSFKVQYNGKTSDELSDYDLTVSPIDVENEISSFNYEYQLRTSSFKVVQRTENDIENDTMSGCFSMYYKIGICPLNNPWKNCYWLNNSSNAEALTDDISVGSLKSLLTENTKFVIRRNRSDTTSLGWQSLAITNNLMYGADGNLFMHPVVVTPMGNGNDYNSCGAHLDHGGFMIKNRCILPIYIKDEHLADILYGFCYIKAFYDNSEINDSENVGKEVPSSEFNYHLLSVVRDYSADIVNGYIDEYMYLICNITDEHMDDNAYASTPEFPTYIEEYSGED